MAASPLSPNAIGSYRYLAGTNFETAITGLAGGGQTGATPITAQMSRIDTITTAGDSVALPKISASPGEQMPGGLGQLVFISNNDPADSAQVFGVTPDTINGIATGTGITLPAGCMLIAWSISYTQSSGVGAWQAMIASSGQGGLLLTTTVPTASAVSETTATPVDVCTLALPPGTWDVSATIDRNLAGTTATIYGGGIGVTANTLLTQAGGSGVGTDPNVTMSATFGTTVTGNFSTAIPPVQCVFTATTTLHLVAADTFSAGTVGVYGTIRARRAMF